MTSQPRIHNASAIRRLARVGMIAGAFVPLLALAQENYLPPEEQVRAALQDAPGVRTAAAHVSGAAATRRALAAGSNEFELSVGAQRRNVSDEGRHYNEWDAQISRAIRLPGKARLDRDIGDSTRSVAELRLIDAEHQAARRLLDMWMQWLRSSVEAREAAAQEDLWKREKSALARRVARGDAAQRELDIMQAEYALLAAQTIATRDAEQMARQALAAEFPPVTVPQHAPALPSPQPLPDGDQAWRERIIHESAEIHIANGESRRQSLVAARTRADRTPDPSVGLRMMSERGGNERVVGVVLSIPFGTDYRSAKAEIETANASAAQMEAVGVRRTVERSAWATVQAASSKYAQWQSQRLALAAQESAGKKTRRAWELGEAPLAEYLLAQRNLRQSRLAESLARVDALQAGLLVRLDAHDFWLSIHGAHDDANPRKQAAAE